MSAITSSRYVLSVSAASIVLLAGCAGSQPLTGSPLDQSHVRPSAALAVVPARRARTGANRGFGTVFALTASGKETVLYSFAGGSTDGAYPYASLLDVNGVLYGTTQSGGAYNGGTLFAITPSGAETVLHSFGSSGDGTDPMAPLIDVNGTLYGTTRYGGVISSACAQGCGVVFSITASGAETVLHGFEGYPSDGAYPAAELLDVDGTLYGTTRAGGSVLCRGSSTSGCGTVFTIAASGQENVLFSFGAKHDDCCPSSGLTNVNGTLYGTTSYKFGKVFQISTTGSESSIHKFKGYNGAKPLGGLIDVGGALYGITVRGGKSDRGTVFAVTTSGAETELYNFSGGADGAHPHASLVDVNGRLYGTVSQGGAADYGAVFTITTSSSEKLLYSFAGYPTDGASPYAGLIDVNRTFYGTTEYGGTGGARRRR
ncbi:MAG: choice-of-anchor tandem repeat GloVer-containing protein [Candidatus Cybelea sp.]